MTSAKYIMILTIFVAKYVMEFILVPNAVEFRLVSNTLKNKVIEAMVTSLKRLW